MGTYQRKTYKNDTIYTFYDYKDINVIYTKDNCYITDYLSLRLLEKNYITQNQKDSLNHDLYSFFSIIQKLDDYTIEEIYDVVTEIRIKNISQDILIKDFSDQFSISEKFVHGLWQEEYKYKFLNEKKTIIFFLNDPSLFNYLEDDIKISKSLNKECILVIGDGFTCINQKQAIQSNINITCKHINDITFDNSQLLLVYGEEGFTKCNNLKCPSIVLGVPKTFFAKAVTGKYDESLNLIYVPECYDITKTVPLIEKTILSYNELVNLSIDFGIDIYNKSVEELYLNYPQYFINIYANKNNSFNIQYNISVNKNNIISSFYNLRDKNINGYLTSKNIKYISTYFNNDYRQSVIPWYPHEKLNGILVQGVICKHVLNASVLKDNKKLDLYNLAKKENESSIVSNFLFFETEKLVKRYNEIRNSRPFEQIEYEQKHLDYMLENNSQRIETFPLYNKACIALKNDGTFLFYNFSLNAGQITFKANNNYTFSWQKENVNPLSISNEDIVIYTPYYSMKDNNFEVGENRINIVIIQEKIICIHNGDVILPSIGVVISLSKEVSQSLLNELNIISGNYYDPSNLNFNIKLDHPDEVSIDDWNNIKWAYGGGLSLIKNGINTFDSYDNYLLKKEGWFTPLSMQTQDTPIQNMACHPRTAIGITKNNEFFILVFSGRSLLSIGADYNDMTIIARKLIRDIKDMINVDGGASSVLGLISDNKFTEINLPASSIDNPAGKARPVITALKIDI